MYQVPTVCCVYGYLLFCHSSLLSKDEESSHTPMDEGEYYRYGLETGLVVAATARSEEKLFIVCAMFGLFPSN
jgi:hypothetical protein